MRIDKEAKKEIDESISTGWYATRKILVRIVVAVIIISIVGAAGNFAYSYWKTNTDRIIFNESEITVLQQKLPARLCEEWSIGEDY